MTPDPAPISHPDLFAAAGVFEEARLAILEIVTRQMHSAHSAHCDLGRLAVLVTELRDVAYLDPERRLLAANAAFVPPAGPAAAGAAVDGADGDADPESGSDGAPSAAATAAAEPRMTRGEALAKARAAKAAKAEGASA